MPNPRVTVMGQPTVTMAAPYVVAGCALPPPPAANGPCVTGAVDPADGLVAGHLERPAAAVVVNSQAICAPTGTPLLIAVTQTRVTGM